MNPQIPSFSNGQATGFSKKKRPAKTESPDALFYRVAHAGDEAAFEKIFKSSYKSLCNFARRFVHDVESSEEIVDDVFYNLWRNRANIKINTCFSAYLLRSVRNRAVVYLRRRKLANASIDLIAEQPCRQASPFENMAFDELNKCIQSGIDSLAPQCRRIFLMSRNRDLTYREIANELSLSVKTVDTQMGRALKHLRDELRGSGL